MHPGWDSFQAFKGHLSNNLPSGWNERKLVPLLFLHPPDWTEDEMFALIHHYSNISEWWPSHVLKLLSQTWTESSKGLTCWTSWSSKNRKFWGTAWGRMAGCHEITASTRDLHSKKGQVCYTGIKGGLGKHPSSIGESLFRRLCHAGLSLTSSGKVTDHKHHSNSS